MRVTLFDRPRLVQALAPFLILLLTVSGIASAGIVDTDLPADSSWYFHTDLKEMRSSDAGRELHAWLDREVFAELRSEIGIDLSKEADRVTAYSYGNDDVVFVLEGNIKPASKDKLMAIAAGADEFATLTHKKMAYHFVRGDIESDGDDIDVDAFVDGAYFSFAIDDKLIATSTEQQMQELLENRGKVAGSRSHKGSMFVLTAERSLVQAGVNADELSDSDNGWDSNFLKNAKQVALLVADAGGKIAIEAQMIAADAEKANALASIARGIIALQAFSEEMEPEIRSILQNTTIDVADTMLKLSLALDPSFVVATLDD
jgi:hypothetical protein